MTIIDKRQPKPRKHATETHTPPKPYEIHRASFNDGDGPNPPVMAVDAQPAAGDIPLIQQRARANHGTVTIVAYGHRKP